MGTYDPDIEDFKTAVSSIQNQSYRNWEFLIVDDGSEAEIYQKIKAVCKEDPRIRLFHLKANKGLAHALNFGIKKAKGTYIARMDDDDVSLPERLKKEVEFLEKNEKYDWVGCGADLFDKMGIWGSASRPKEPDRYSFLHSSPFIHPSVLFRRKAIADCGGYNEGLFASRCEDYELFMRLYACGSRGYNIQEVLFQYREDSKKLHRSMKYCFYEMQIRRKGFSAMKILSWKTFPFVFKPLAVGMASFCPQISQKLRIKKNKGDWSIEKKKQ